MEGTVEHLDKEADLLKALAHPTRLAILETLSLAEECVCHLSYQLAKPQPYISKQLAELREARLVIDRRDGMRTYYRLADTRISSILEQIRTLTGRKLPPGRRNLTGCPCPRCE